MAEYGKNETPPRRDLNSTIALFYQARRGNTRSLDLLYTRYLPRLNRWARGRLPGKARPFLETGDIVLETLGHFLCKMQDFEPRHDGSLMAYLCTAIQNRIRDIYRYSGRKPDQVDVEPEQFISTERSPFELCVDRETRERYAKALEKLCDDERAAVTMKVELAFGPTEIAEALGKSSPDAARMYTQRAIQKLAKEMGHD
ncbi:MAG: sigma-70 family RNA polymerase sigma factor [Phycisphaerae bacterium]|nr:sigma-70 family RNA polymerase sigma factor [Phycisphaerae bacterium]